MVYTPIHNYIYLQSYHIFGWFWTSQVRRLHTSSCSVLDPPLTSMHPLLTPMQFFLAFQELTIAGAVASWFFTRDKTSLHLPVLAAYWRTIR